MLLAAGLGNRLKPLTNNLPKCLMPIANQPLLKLALKRLQLMGVGQVVVNAHHLASQVEDYINTLASGLSISISHEPLLLGTGGALQKAAPKLGSRPFWVMNADIVFDLDLTLLPALMERDNAILCLGLIDNPQFNSVAVDDKGRLLGVKGYQTLAADIPLFTYSGIAYMRPEFLDYLPAGGPADVLEGWFKAMAAGETIVGVKLKGFWDDLGTWQHLWAANQKAALGQLPGFAEPPAVLKGENVAIASGAHLQGFCFLSDNVRVAGNAFIKNSVLLPGAVAGTGSHIENSIIGKDFAAQGNYINDAFA